MKTYYLTNIIGWCMIVVAFLGSDNTILRVSVMIFSTIVFLYTLFLILWNYYLNRKLKLELRNIQEYSRSVRKRNKKKRKKSMIRQVNRAVRKDAKLGKPNFSRVFDDDWDLWVVFRWFRRYSKLKVRIDEIKHGKYVEGIDVTIEWDCD